MSRTGPVTKDTRSIALGLAQIRVAPYAAYKGQIRQILPATKSVGALAETKFVGNVDFFKLESGFPMLEDAVFPLREAAAMEIAFKELSPANIALARGLNPENYSNAHQGTIPLGQLIAPVYIRMEAVYTYPDGTNTMVYIFPRAQVVAEIEMDFAAEEPAAVSMRIEAKRCDGEVVDTDNPGQAIWNGAPLGRIVCDDGTQTTTTTSTTTTTTTQP